MEEIIDYLKAAYDPLAILVYGSYADGSNNAGSDFDALVISNTHREFHDVSFVGGIQLDVFVRPTAPDPGDFPQLAHSLVVLDTKGLGASLKEQAAAHLAALPPKSDEEIHADIEWCIKMLTRTRRGDTEGCFRWHWLLTESLEIFCESKNHPYQGPKKSLQWMQAQHPEAFAVYQNALFRFDRESLEKWIHHLASSEDKTSAEISAPSKL